MKTVFKAVINIYALAFGLIGGLEALQLHVIKPHGVAIVLFMLACVAAINLIFLVCEDE
jgi:hypothetical protein